MNSGISFIVRVRNEEDCLEESIRSLFSLTIPHEIILILHCCTDRSLEIAKKLADENKHIKIIEYDVPISRPGYETLCTPSHSKHSVVDYYNSCFGFGKCSWLFKWDADFIASKDLIDYLNHNSWDNPVRPTEIIIPAASEDSKNEERYLFSRPFTFSKFWFWETFSLTGTPQQFKISYEIKHNSLLKNKKSYWKEPAWFEDSNYLELHPEEKEEADIILKKYKYLTSICGSEPNGQARASNPESTMVFYSVKNKQAQLELADIFYYK